MTFSHLFWVAGRAPITRSRVVTKSETRSLPSQPSEEPLSGSRFHGVKLPPKLKGISPSGSAGKNHYGEDGACKLSFCSLRKDCIPRNAAVLIVQAPHDPF